LPITNYRPFWLQPPASNCQTVTTRATLPSISAFTRNARQRSIAFDNTIYYQMLAFARTSKKRSGKLQLCMELVSLILE